MPLRKDLIGDDPNIPVRPDTNSHEILSLLVENFDVAFTPSEIDELTDVSGGSVHKTLSRLEDRSLVESIDGYWTATDDVVSSHLGSVVSLDAIEDRYSDDYYAENDDWVEDLPDLGENA